jgi:SAM-dependent methyltransferase
MNESANRNTKLIQAIGRPITVTAPAVGECAMKEMEENPWGYRRRIEFIAKSIAERFSDRDPGAVRILDIGCGNGSWVALPLARCGYDVTGIDLHQPSIDTARSLARGLPNAHFAVGTVEELKEAGFDVIILSEVLEHVHEPEALLRTGAAQLGPGGIVIVTVPNGYGEFEIDWWIYRTFRLEWIVNAARSWFPSLRMGDRDADRAKTVRAATDNLDCGHVQFFRLPILRRIFTNCSLVPVTSEAACLMCGPLAVLLLARSRRLIEWNVRVAKRLPLILGSGWYFVLRHQVEVE